MRKFISLAIISIFLTSSIQSVYGFTSSPIQGRDKVWKIQEEDGTPATVSKILKVSDGSLTDNVDGTFSLATVGDVVSTGVLTATTVAWEGGTFDTLFVAGTPTEDVQYVWPLSDGTAGQVLHTNAGGTLTWEADDGAGGGAPVDAEYVTLSNDGSLTQERVLTAGIAIDLTDAGANSTFTVDFDSTEVEATTWGAGGNATNVHTFDVSGTDTTLTYGDGNVLVGGDWDVSSDTVTGSVVAFEGGAFDTLFIAGTPSEDVQYRWPLADGTSGQQLQTDGGGTLTWAADGAGSGWTDDGSTVRLTTSGDNVSIGADAEPNTQKLQVTGDTLTTGEFIEQTGSSGTGDTVVSNRLIYTPSADTSITAAGGITVTNALMRIQGDGGAIDITADPQIVAGTSDGQIVVLQGVSDANTVTLDDGTGLALAGGVSFVIGNNDNIGMMWDSGESEWLENNRADLN